MQGKEIRYQSVCLFLYLKWFSKYPRKGCNQKTKHLKSLFLYVAYSDKATFKSKCQKIRVEVIKTFLQLFTLITKKFKYGKPGIRNVKGV